MDSYNAAIKHLQAKYGRQIGYTSNFEAKLRKARNNAERKQLEANATDRDKNIVIIEGLIDNHDDSVMFLLVNQHQYGIEPKKELAQHLKNMGINFVD